MQEGDGAARAWAQCPGPWSVLWASEVRMGCPCPQGRLPGWGGHHPGLGIGMRGWGPASGTGALPSSLSFPSLLRRGGALLGYGGPREADTGWFRSLPGCLSHATSAELCSSLQSSQAVPGRSRPFVVPGDAEAQSLGSASVPRAFHSGGFHDSRKSREGAKRSGRG